MKLRQKTALALLATALIPVALLGAIGFATQRSRLTDDLLARLEAVAAVQEQRIEQSLESRRVAAELVASRTRLRQVLADGRDLEVAGQIIADAQRSTSSVQAIVIFDTTGRVVATAGEAEVQEPTDVARVLADADADADARIDTSEDGSRLTLLQPLALDGAVVGAVATVFDSSFLRETTNDYTGLGDTGETLIAELDDDGSAHYLAPLRFDRDAPTSRRIGGNRGEVPITRALAGDEVVLSDATDYRGERVFAATRVLEDVGWGVVVKMDVSEALQPVDDFRDLVLWLGALVVAAAGLLASFLSRRLSRPVQQLTETAARITAGDHSVRAEVCTGDEREQLADAFNELVDQLTRLNRDLERRVGLRTEELQEANETLARTVQQLEQFAYVTSHDLQEPLRSIVGFTELLERKLEGQLDDTTRQYMNFVTDGARRMQDLIHDLLAYSRAGRTEPDLAPVDLDAMVHDLLRQLSASTEGAQLEVQPLPTVVGDKKLLRQMAQNLITNALKFRRPDTEHLVRISATTEPDGWRISVVDNGVGIAPEYRERVFGVFQRLHTRDEYSGTGIGLAICHTVVERHGGTIEVGEGIDGGAAFSVHLPRLSTQGSV